ncbi:hypothetical protein GTY65_36535 [Streptomyces sp. SID8379]|uniref:hypothetical protein n=1 Tax=unclassified Streptomyces TaxID=2593676 RepID=UPI0003753931|nr:MULTISPECIES: hypothetical protein [unclassified Streptomyces]MYW69535.1 hypothetical protein [Streptomyces sp. SID8379]
MNSAEKLISHAREGHFEEALPQLLEIARRPGGARGPVWESAAASIQILLWLDRPAEAADLADSLIRTDGPSGGELCDQDMPFDEALLAAPEVSPAAVAARLAAVAETVPAGRVLQTRLQWLSEELPRRSPEELMPGFRPWGVPLPPSGPKHRSPLVERDFETLTDDEKRVVWQSLRNANDFPRAHELATRGGHIPPQYAVCSWMAGWYAVQGDIERGENMLLAAHGRWHPYKNWDAIPTAPVLQPTLRLVTTDRVREHYLTRPIGPEAK